MKKLFSLFKEYCQTIYEEPMAIFVFVIVISSAIVFMLGETIREGLVPIWLVIVPILGLIFPLGGMYLLGRHWAKIDKNQKL